jgi:hypothetical protein
MNDSSSSSPTQNTIVKFNIGGTIFSTLAKNVTKPIVKKSNKKQQTNDDDAGSVEYYEPNLLARLMNDSESYDNDTKAIFIDRNPQYFSHILDFLRLNDKYRLPTSGAATATSDCQCQESSLLNSIYKEAEFYQVNALIDMLVPFRDSTILTPKNAVDLINLCGFSIPDTWTLLYRGGAGGNGCEEFDKKKFQAKCDRMPQSLIIAKSKGASIFGCYTEKGWNASNKSGQASVDDSSSFLFSLISNEDVDFAFFKANTVEVYSRTLPSIIRV